MYKHTVLLIHPQITVLRSHLAAGTNTPGVCRRRQQLRHTAEISELQQCPNGNRTLKQQLFVARTTSASTH